LWAAVTFDVEADCPGVADSHVGLRLGLPQLLRMLEGLGVKATFFVTGGVARRFPGVVRGLAEEGHEVACHGLTHDPFGSPSGPGGLAGDLEEARRIVEEAAGSPVSGFRAPRLRVSPLLFRALAEAGFSYDSSLAWWVPGHRGMARVALGAGIAEFPLLLPNVLLRFPLGSQLFRVLSLLAGRGASFPGCWPAGPTPLVLFFHPSEAVSMASLLRRWGVPPSGLASRPDRWVATGEAFTNRLEGLLKFLLARGFRLAPLGFLLRLGFGSGH